jgi:hypothetical protein
MEADAKHYPDRNIENMAFHFSAQGKQWMSNKDYDPFVNAKYKLEGSLHFVDKSNKPTGSSSSGYCKYTQLLLDPIITNDEPSVNFNDNIQHASNFLTVQVFLPLIQMAPRADLGRIRLAGEVTGEVTTEAGS